MDISALSGSPARRLMIVDDNEETGSGLAAFFGHHGFHALAFADGRRALEHLRGEPVDLVIIDLFMPEIDGFELMRELQPFKPRPRVLAMSGGAPHILRVARILGADDVISKPIETGCLLQLVREIMARPLPATSGGLGADPKSRASAGFRPAMSAETACT